MQTRTDRLNQLRLFLKFFRYLLSYRKKVIWLVAVNSTTVILALANPFITKLVIDRAIGNKDLTLFFILTAIGAGIFVVNGLLFGLVDYLRRILDLNFEFGLRRRIVNHLNRLSLSFFRDKPVGQQLYRINYDVDFVTDFLTGILPEAIEIFPRILFTLIIVFYLDKRLALLSILLSPFLYLPPYFFNRKLREIFKELNRMKEVIFSRFIEVFSQIHLVKALGRETQETRSYLRRIIASIRMEIVNTRLEIALNFLSNSANRIIVGGIAFYGGFLVIKGKMSLGSLTAIMIYLSQLVGLQGGVIDFFRRLNLGLVSCQRIDDILQEGPARTRAGTRRFDFPKGEILFSDCTFGYKEGALVLDKINFKIGSGSAVALVGPSGCGKTTIVNLILRLYEPLSGDIFIDGENIKDLDPGCLYNQIGVALQQPFLWDDSIENNIRYGKPDCLAEEIIHAAEITGLDILVKSLPEGYQTKVGEDAGKISQGQKQRIAISRAIIKRPRILILDEAMSSLDTESEQKILQSIFEERKGLTTIVISHRPSAIAMVGRACFMERKDRMLCGTSQELRASSSAFAQLFNPKKS